MSGDGRSLKGVKKKTTLRQIWLKLVQFSCPEKSGRAPRVEKREPTATAVSWGGEGPSQQQQRRDACVGHHAQEEGAGEVHQLATAKQQQPQPEEETDRGGRGVCVYDATQLAFSFNCGRGVC